MLAAFEQGLKDIIETPELSDGIFFYNDEQETKFTKSCKELTRLLEKLKNNEDTHR
jgi:hypothetical protein